MKCVSLFACGGLILLLVGCGKESKPTEPPPPPPVTPEPKPEPPKVEPLPPDNTPPVKKPPEKKPEEKPVSPEEVKAAIAAWEKAGAKYNPPDAGKYRVHTFRLKDEMTDNDLKALPAMPVPFGLVMFETKASSAGLRGLARYKHLTELDLSTSPLGDSDASGLKSLPLTSLSLWGTRVSDDGLHELKTLQQLKRFDLGYTTVTDKGLKHVGQLKNLTWLNLDSAKGVTDAGLAELKPLEQLAHLDLTGTDVSDAGLKELHALKSLAELKVEKTRVTDAGIAELKAALPKCQVRTGK